MKLHQAVYQGEWTVDSTDKGPSSVVIIENNDLFYVSVLSYENSVFDVCNSLKEAEFLIQELFVSDEKLKYRGSIIDFSHKKLKPKLPKIDSQIPEKKED